MAEIKPIKGWRYNRAKVKPEDVITLPYDKISPSLQEEYYKRSPYNLVRLILGKIEERDNDQSNRYTRALEFLKKWQKENVLAQDAKEAIYLYDQHFTVPGTHEKRVRRSFIAALKLEDFSTGKVRPHERTLAGPKADRIKLLRTTHTHFGLIFMMYEDLQRKISHLLEKTAIEPAIYDFIDDQQVQNKLWIVDDPKMISQVQEIMKNKTLFIADGHHRYETALTLKNENSKNGAPSKFDYAMMAFTNLSEEGLVVLPTHRMVKNRPGFNAASFLKECEEVFTVAKEKNIETLFSLMNQKSSQHVIGVYTGRGNFYSLTLKGNGMIQKMVQEKVPKAVANLDVMLLHKILLEEKLGITQEQVASGEALHYCRDKNRGVEEVDQGKAQITFFLNPTPAKQVQEVCMAGEVLPQKSTDFFPKLLSGMVIHQL